MSNIFLTRLSAILIIVVLLLVYFLGCSVVKSAKKENEQTNLINALGDTLKLTRLSDSSQKAAIQAFVTEKIKDFYTIKSKDSTIVALQDIVRQNEKKLKGGGSAVVVKGETSIVSSGPTIIEHTNYDTVDKPVFPVYKATIIEKRGWYTIKSRADKDSTHIDLTIANSYDVIVGKEKGKWFANVTNHNPYSSIKSMRAYHVEVPETRQKRVNLAIFGGYGYNLQGEVRGTPLIGAGISYTILSLF
jgi:hypothetical protein